MARVSTAQRKRIAEIKARARQARMMEAKRTGESVIPDKFLRQLAAFNLPPIKFVYEACLEKLMRDA